MIRAIAASLLLLTVACAESQPAQPTSAPVHFYAAGSTLAEPFLTRVFYEYSVVHPEVTIDYAAVGSGAGLEALRRGTVDFAASDTPLNDAEVAAMGGPGAVVQIPSTVGAVAVAFRLDGIPRLQLDGATLAGIYLGLITRWSDPRLQSLNQEVVLPDLPIQVVHRSDSSGTSYLFTDYLARVSPTWESRLGASKNPPWPVGTGANGSEGMVRAVSERDGSIGYVDLTYLHGSSIAAAFIKNRSQAYVNPTAAGAAAAAAAAVMDVSPTRPSIADREGPGVYPIAGLSWLVARRLVDPTRAPRRQLFRWVVTEGQKYASPLDYAPLPALLRWSNRLDTGF